MRRQLRSGEPTVLIEGKTEWTTSWVARAAEGKAWNWPKRNNMRLNILLVEALRRQTVDHCSFCDGYPVVSRSPQTIEHFRPKSHGNFPQLAFEWSNLFYCCSRCQQAKREEFDDRLLKPDDADYQFDRYFICDYTTGHIEPNPNTNEADRERAIVTIRIYRLNEDGLPAERIMWLGFRRKMSELPLDDFSFRDFLS